MDDRGRVVVPVWLRQAAGPSASLLVGVRSGVTPIVVVAPTRVLHGLGEALAGEER